MAASMDVMASLHKALAKQLLRVLEEGVPLKVDDEGEVIYRPASAAELGVAVAFLKANNITASVDDNDELKALVEKMRAGSKSRKITPITDFPDAGGTAWQ